MLPSPALAGMGRRGSLVSWDDEVAELRRREAFARAMGGPESVARQHSRGKLTVRERIDLLADPGSFREFGALRGQRAPTTSDGDLAAFTPKGEVDGIVPHRRPQGRRHRRRLHRARRLRRRPCTAGSARSCAPTSGRWSGASRYVRLLDAAGGSVRSFEELGRTYLPDGNIWSTASTSRC